MSEPSAALGVAGALIAWSAIAALALGIAARIARWLRAPQPLPIPLTPAPLSAAGAALRLARETLFFESLFRADRGLWALGWTFHAALLVTVLHHARFFTPEWGPWTGWLAARGPWWSGALLVSLGGLWVRRLAIDRVRFVSAPSDHLVLALIAGIALSGVTLKYLHPVDLVATKRFARGLATLAFAPLPAHPVLLVHLALVATLVAVLPSGKLLHGPGAWFSPTRYRPDDARERGAGKRPGRRDG